MVKIKRAKYNNKKTLVDGIWFDSKAEAMYYIQLKALKESGEVHEIELQPAFVLVPSYYRIENGKRIKVREMKYKADFKVVYRDGRVEYIDVKGKKTAVYELKKKLLLWRYPLIAFREVS